jgi:hypothetical protein
MVSAPSRFHAGLIVLDLVQTDALSFGFMPCCCRLKTIRE